MPRVQLNVGNGFYESPSLPLSNQRCVNLYPNIPQAPALTPDSLFGVPGIQQVVTTGVIKQANRGAWSKNGIPYFVNGTKLYRLDRSIVGGEVKYAAVELGEIPGTGRCSFADNGKQLMVLVPGADGYIYDESAGTPFQTIIDADFKANGNPQQVVFVDSFFVVTTDTKKIIKSAANNGLSWNALDFGSAEVDPDDIVAPHVFRNQLFIGGSETFEVFENIGTGGFPFQRVNGFVIPKGLVSPYAIVSTNDAFMWVGGDANESPAIWLLNGSTAQKASTTAIDGIISRLSKDELSSSFAWSYAQSGAYFVGFTFPSITVVFDTVSGKWHERESQIINSKGFEETVRYRVNSIVSGYGEIYVADSQDGRIGRLSIDVYSEYDRPIISKFSLPPLYNQGNNISITQLELLMESGVGNEDADNPEVRLRTSEDGKVFSEPRTSFIGAIGDYKRRQIWRRLGRFPRMAVMEFTVSDACKRAIYGIEMNIKGGRNIGR